MESTLALFFNLNEKIPAPEEDQTQLTKGNGEKPPVKEKVIDTPTAKKEVESGEISSSTGEEPEFGEKPNDGVGETTASDQEGGDIEEELITDFPFVLPDFKVPIELYKALFENEGKDDMDDSDRSPPEKVAKRRKRDNCEEATAHGDTGLPEREEKKCPVEGCTETLRSSEDLVEHMMTHPKPVICGVCKRSYPTGSKLRQHYRTHSGERPFECDDCKKTFTKEFNLRVHQRIHTGERPYSCTICEKHYSHMFGLTVHMRIHTGERPYKCDVCVFATTDKSTLTRHKRIHTGEKPYSCTTCEYKSAHPAGLTRHRKSHSH